MLTDSTAIITGGASGIGREICYKMANYGADIVVADIQEEPRKGGIPTTELINDSTDSEAAFVECDVSIEQDIRKGVEIAKEFGEVDIFVNNAGILLNSKPTIDIDEEMFETLIKVNLYGVFNGSKVAAEVMKENQSGSIINISSINALRPPPGLPIYSATKGAVMSFTYGLAAEVGPYNVRVNCIHPGPTKTQLTMEDSEKLGTEKAEEHIELIPLRRYAKPEDIANVAVFLGSDLSNYITAQSIVIDGGFSNTASGR